MILPVLAVALAAAAPAPSARTYNVTLTGTQESTWSFSETGTCTGDDFEEHPFSGEGAGTSTVAFRTPRRSRLVVSRVVGTKRWAFAYQPYDVRAEGTRTGTHRQTCPNSETATFTSPTDGCGARTFGMAVKAPLNLPANRKPGFLDFTATQNGGGTGAGWGDDCPYFYGLDVTDVDDELGLGFDLPSATLLAVRKQVATGALRRGRPLVINARRTKRYDTSDSTGDTTRVTKGETTVKFRIAMTPVKR